MRLYHLIKVLTVIVLFLSFSFFFINDVLIYLPAIISVFTIALSKILTASYLKRINKLEKLNFVFDENRRFGVLDAINLLIVLCLIVFIFYDPIEHYKWMFLMIFVFQFVNKFTKINSFDIAFSTNKVYINRSIYFTDFDLKNIKEYTSNGSKILRFTFIDGKQKSFGMIDNPDECSKQINNLLAVK